MNLMGAHTLGDTAPVRVGVCFLIAALKAMASAQIAAAHQTGSTAPAPTGSSAVSQTEEANLAKELSNPVASLISVPFQDNFDFGIGPNRLDQKRRKAILR